MKNNQPKMAKNCVNAFDVMEAIYDKYPQLPVKFWVTHLWEEIKKSN